MYYQVNQLSSSMYLATETSRSGALNFVFIPILFGSTGRKTMYPFANLSFMKVLFNNVRALKKCIPQTCK